MTCLAASENGSKIFPAGVDSLHVAAIIVIRPADVTRRSLFSQTPVTQVALVQEKRQKRGDVSAFVLWQFGWNSPEVGGT